MNRSTHYQLRGMDSTLRMRTAISPRQFNVADMDSCFVLVTSHQHGIASTVSLLPPLIDSTAMTC